MFKNVATKIALFAFDTTTGAPKTGDSANLTAYVAKDYGTVTVLADTSATEMDATNAKGWYLFDVAQAETNADALLFTGKSSTANITLVGQHIFTTPANFSSASIDSNGRVDVIKIAGTSQTARDVGASVLLSSGTGTGQLDFTSGVVKANATQWLGGTIPAVNVTGVPLVDAKYLLGTAFATPATAGVLDANVKNINNVAAATPGASGGVLISGSNSGTTTLAALTVTGATTLTGNVALADGLSIAAPSTTNRAGLDITGNGTGAAMKLAAGATGKGIAITTTAGDGVSILPTAGHGIVATGNGTSKHGAILTGGTAGTSDGMVLAAGTGGVDFRANQTGNLTGTVATLTTYTGNTPQTGDAYARIGAPAGASLAVDVAAVNAKTTNLPAAPASTTNITAGTITTVTNVTNAPTAGDFTATMKTSIGTAVAASAVASVTGSIGSIAADGITDASFAAGTGKKVVRAATAAAGAASTITLDGSASATDSIYNGCLLYLTGGAGAGQTRTVTGYVGSTQVATVDRAWQTNPDSTSTFAILPADGPKVDASLQTTAASVQGNITGSVASVTGAVGSVTGNVGGAVASVTARVTANADQLAGQTITAAAGVTFPSSVASPTNITAGTITTVTNLTNAPTAGDLTATMKTSVTTAATAATPTAAAVTGAVGSVGAGGITASSFASGAINDTAIATDALGALELAAGAASEIATAVRSELTTELGRIDVATSTRLATSGYTAPPTAVVVADEVQTRTIAAVTTVNGLAANVITAASAAADFTTEIQTGLATASALSAVASNVSAVKTQTDKMVFTVANQLDVNVLGWKSATAPAMTGDAFARLGAPVGASLSVDLAAVKTAVDAVPTEIENADALLDRDMSAGADTNSRSPRNALRLSRNKWAVSGTTLTVKKEDDTTTAWTAALTAAPGADPISGSDPS